ncbi:MAG: Na+/H+ antiporter subunit E [Thermoplasmatota archaeon]
MSRSLLSIVITFVLLFLAWLMLTSSLQYQEIIAGALIAGALGVFLSGVLPSPGKGSIVRRLVMFPVYLLFLFKEMIMANLDVAYRVLHPKMPIRPGIIKVRPDIESDMGRLILANSITLTPGTLSVDYIGDDLYIHWIDVKKGEERSAMGSLEKRVKEVFP